MKRRIFVLFVLAFLGGIAVAIFLHFDKYEFGSPLLNAAARGDVKKLGSLLDAGVNIETTNQYGYTAISAAIYCHNYESLKYLLSRNADADASPNGVSNLVRAIDVRDIDCAIALLNAGADPNKPAGWLGITPLMRAICTNQPAIIEQLIRFRANIEATDNNGWRALHYALQCEDLSISQRRVIVGILVDAGVDYRARNVSTKNGQNIVDSLGTSDSSREADYGKYPFEIAQRRGYIELAEYLKRIATETDSVETEK